MHQDEILKLIKKLDNHFILSPIEYENDSKINKLYEILRELLKILLQDSWNGVD